MPSINPNNKNLSATLSTEYQSLMEDLQPEMREAIATAIENLSERHMFIISLIETLFSKNSLFENLSTKAYENLLLGQKASIEIFAYLKKNDLLTLSNILRVGDYKGDVIKVAQNLQNPISSRDYQVYAIPQTSYTSAPRVTFSTEGRLADNSPPAYTEFVDEAPPAYSEFEHPPAYPENEQEEILISTAQVEERPPAYSAYADEPPAYMETMMNEPVAVKESAMPETPPPAYTFTPS